MERRQEEGSVAAIGDDSLEPRWLEILDPQFSVELGARCRVR